MELLYFNFVNNRYKSKINFMEAAKNNNKSILIALAVLVVALAVYLVYSNQQHKKLTNEIEQEKIEVGVQLDSMIVKYEDAISENTSMRQELEFERDRIMVLRDSLRETKATDYATISRLRRRIAQLEETNRKLFRLNDSLTGKNRELTRDLDLATIKIKEEVARADTLTQENLNLSAKVEIGQMLKIKDAKVLAMRQKNNGQYVETKRSRYTDAFRVNFTIEANAITEKGEKSVYVQLVDAAGNVVVMQGEVQMPASMLSYSDSATVDYANQEVDVISLIEVNREAILKGEFTANVYIEDYFVAGAKITLK